MGYEFQKWLIYIMNAISLRAPLANRHFFSERRKDKNKEGKQHAVDIRRGGMDFQQPFKNYASTNR